MNKNYPLLSDGEKIYMILKKINPIKLKMTQEYIEKRMKNLQREKILREEERKRQLELIKKNEELNRAKKKAVPSKPINYPSEALPVKAKAELPLDKKEPSPFYGLQQPIEDPLYESSDKEPSFIYNPHREPNEVRVDFEN